MRPTRMGSLVLLLTVVPLLTAAGRAAAAPTLWPANGHSYDVVLDSQRDWIGAKAAAESAVHEGRRGHLATIGDAAEDAFVSSLVSAAGGGARFLGAYQSPGAPGTGAGWEWVTGEPFGYANWGLGQPDDAGGGFNENVLTSWGPLDPAGVLQWNDWSHSYPLQGYVVEYEADLCGLPGGKREILTTAALPGFPPKVGDEYVIWKDPSYAISVYDRTAQTVSTIASSYPGPLLVPQKSYEIGGGKVVWEDHGPIPTIRVLELATGQQTQITSAVRSPVGHPSTDGASVAWEDHQFGPDIWHYDVASGVRTRITSHPSPQMFPAVSGTNIVWQDARNGNGDIYLHDLTTGSERRITSNAASQQFPAISGTRIVWQDLRNGNPDIYLYDLATGVETPLTTDPAAQSWPAISGDRVAWLDHRHGSAEVYLFDLTTMTESRITTDSVNQSEPSISGDTIVWSEGSWVVAYDLGHPPCAAAGPDQTVRPGVSVSLDGSPSTDPDGNYPLAYSWRILMAPSGSSAALSDPGAPRPALVPDALGDYLIELVVTDGRGFRSAPDTVTVSTFNTPPVAAAGPDQSIRLLGSLVQLDGSGSYDDDGDDIAFLWTLAVPPRSAAVLSDPTAAAPTFLADVQGDYHCTLTVQDVYEARSVADAVMISFENVRPVADAGGNRSVPVGTEVLLDGSASADANGDPLSFRWSLVARPEGSQAALSCTMCHAEPWGPLPPTPPPAGSHGASATITPDVPGLYVASLVVHDGFVASEPANVTITATSGVDALLRRFPPLVELINGLPAGAFKNPNMRNALTNKLAAVLMDIERGNYAEALSKLEHDILGKTDGCALAGTPDKNDWIISCTYQGPVHAALLDIITLLTGLI